LLKLKRKEVEVEDQEVRAGRPEDKGAERQVVVDKEAAVAGDKNIIKLKFEFVKGIKI
jgi:hypothetical protein